jgi:hypothetical protein
MNAHFDKFMLPFARGKMQLRDAGPTAFEKQPRGIPESAATIG